MAKKIISIPSVLSFICIITFATLLSLRLGLFSQPDAVIIEDTQLPAQAFSMRSWMNILQQKKKIGYAFRWLKETEDGYTISETVQMRITALGSTQNVRYRTEASLHKDMSLVNFSFQLGADLVNFSVMGEHKDKKLIFYTGNGNNRRKTEIPMESPPQLGTGLLYGQAVAALKTGESRVFSVFDPAIVAQKNATVTVDKEVLLDIMGQQIPAKEITIDFLGNTQKAWINSEGEILAEEGPMGLRLEKVSQDEALSGEILESTDDLVQYASVRTNTIIEHPESLTRLVIRISGADEFADRLSDGRQVYANGILTVTSEKLLQKQARTNVLHDEKIDAYLQPGPFVQSDHDKILALAEKIVNKSDSQKVKAQKIVDWVFTNIEKKPVFSLPDALATLHTRAGDCNEHAILVAALARAAGVPARMEVGLAYLKGRFYYHAWNSFYLDSWRTADAVFGQFPADVTHLSFARGNPQAQLSIMSLIGRLNLEIVEMDS